MRTHLFSLLLGTACMGIAELSAQGWVIGGNNVAANSSLGTNTNYSLIFETNNTERARITNGGNLLIGTSTAPSKLAVNSVSGVSPFRAQIAGVNKLVVNSNGGTSIGSSTAGPANGLYVAGSVGIGTAFPSNKLHVIGTIYGASSSPTAGVFGFSSYSGGEGVRGQSSNIGVYGYGGNYGVYAVAFNSTGWGVFGSGQRGVYGIGLNGVYGISNVGGGNALYGTTSQASAYGVFGASTQSFGVYGYTGNTSSYAGYFAGKVNATGGYFSVSDGKFKQNVTGLDNALAIISKLQPKQYEYKQEGDYRLMNFPGGKHFGLVAQELEEVLPNLVHKSQFNITKAKLGEVSLKNPGTPSASEKIEAATEELIDFKAVNYTELIPIMVKAMQEQQQHIEKQQQENIELLKRIEKLEQLVTKLSGVQGFNAFLSSAELGEVSPNPVKGAASIQYFIPEGSTRAQLLITDVLGRQIKTIKLTTSGVINVDVTSLASGVYNYSLIIDNKTLVTRKMTVVK